MMELIGGWPLALYTAQNSAPLLNNFEIVCFIECGVQFNLKFFSEN